MTPARPPFRYHGSKWQIAPWIIEHMAPHNCYLEPFGGSAAVLLRKPRVPNEIYNDLNGDIVNVFRVLRDPAAAAELQRRLYLTPYARAEYYAARAAQPNADPIEQARITLIRANMGHGSNGSCCNTGFRNARRGTDPSVARDWANYPQNITAFVERLRGVIIENRPALDVIDYFDRPDTLIYVDPPYLPAIRERTHQYRHELTPDDHTTLADALHQVSAAVIISTYPSPVYDELYGDWTRYTTVTKDQVNNDKVEAIFCSRPANQLALFQS